MIVLARSFLRSERCHIKTSSWISKYIDQLKEEDKQKRNHIEPLACLFSNMIIFDDDLQEAAASWARLDQETK